MQAHGGDIYSMAEALGVGQERIMDFSASINPLGIPDKAAEAIRRHAGEIAAYPDPENRLLVGGIAGFFGVDPRRVIIGNGSTELIYLIPRGLRPAIVLIPQPAFSEYERASRLAGADVRRLMLKRKDGFRVIPDEFISAMRGADMAFLCNPNNPTGDMLSREAVLDIARNARRLKCLLVVDEAFIDFCPGGSVLGIENPYLVVLRSMTKFYALAGLRLGFGVFPGRLAARLRRWKEPWTVNTLAGRAGEAALGDEGFRQRTLGLIEEERGFLNAGFGSLGIRYYPPAANFYLLNIRDAGRVAEGLLGRLIAVRRCRDFRGLGGGFIRVAVRGREENAALMGGLRELCS